MASARRRRRCGLRGWFPQLRCDMSSHPGITVDIDGELSFDLRLKDGRLVFAELGFDGLLDVGVYGSDGRMLEHDAQATCAYLLSVIES